MPPQTSFARILQSYLDDCGLSQESFERLTVRLARIDDRVIRIPQQQLSRWVNKEVPTPGNVQRLAVVLTYAMHEAGFDEVTEQAIMDKLMLSRRERVYAKEVSRFAADIDAVLAPLPPRTRAAIEASLMAAAVEFVPRFMEIQKSLATRTHNTAQHSPDDDA